MKILLVHNFYQQPGGEDQVFAEEGKLLEVNGQDVQRFIVHNDSITGMGQLTMLKKTIWNTDIAEQLRTRIREFRPQIVHFHNTFPLISPAAYKAAKDEGCSVVQTLHNYRLLCVNALMMRDGKACEDCLGKRIAFPGIRHACYRGSRSASAAVAAMQTVHRTLGTYCRYVDVFIALTGFARDKFIAGGLPADKIVVKPNFVFPTVDAGTGQGGYAVFVGRLSEEKGIRTLLDAWKIINADLPLKIIGDGPLRDLVASAVQHSPHIEYLGRRPSETVYEMIGNASMLILPSNCYEGFPCVLAEAFAKGTPAVVSNHGAMSSIVKHNTTGRFFRPGDAADLAAQVRHLLKNPAELARMRLESRREYEAEYNCPRSYKHLLSIYDRAIHAGSPEYSAGNNPLPSSNP